MALTGQWGDVVGIYRWDGEITIPSVIFFGGGANISQPINGSWMWRDLNGDGNFEENEFFDILPKQDIIWFWSFTPTGDIWHCNTDTSIIRHYPVQGIDSVGNPIYSLATSVAYDKPALFTEIDRAIYIPLTDTLFISGFTSENPSLPGGPWGLIGREVIRFDKWIATNGTSAPTFRATVPYALTNNTNITKSFAVAGDVFVVGICGTGEQLIYDANTGVYIDTIIPATESGWLDMIDATHVFQRANGDYMVISEEDWHIKNSVYGFSYSSN